MPIAAEIRSGFPSLLRSERTTVPAYCCAAKSTTGAKEEGSIGRLALKVTSNASVAEAGYPCAVTVTGAYVAPLGTVTVSDLADAAVTNAPTGTKNTIVFSGTRPQSVPEITTEVQIDTERG